MPTPYRDVAHLLRRAGFGGLPSEISALTQFSRAEIVDKLLDMTNVPAVNMPAEVTDTTLPNRDDVLTRWTFNRMAVTGSPLIEKIALFWNNHFTTSRAKSDVQNYWTHFYMLRSLGLGSFVALAQASALSPAMLQWLDNESNVKSAPNENFARELMELFTVGVNQYTQADVVAAARAWTGHGLSADKHSYVFTASRHDSGNKAFLGTTRNWDGPDIINELCLGSKRLVTARFIAKKIWTYFAGPDPSSDLLDVLQNQFAQSDLDITVLLRTIFNSDEFYADEERHNHVRGPFEFLVALMRYMNVTAETLHAEAQLAAMNAALYTPPNVAGWGTGLYWVSASSMWARSNAVRTAMWAAKLAGLLSDTKNYSITTAVQHALDTFGIDEPTASTRVAMENCIYGDRYVKSTGSEIQNLIQLAALSPEFQVG